MVPTQALACVLFAFSLVACTDDPDPTDDSGGSSGEAGGADGNGGDGNGAGAASGGSGGEGASSACAEPGKPEMTGPIAGIAASYAAGDPIDVSVPVDADTARVIVGVYEVGSALYLGGTAEEASGASAVDLSFFAGVAGGETGTFYLSVELCSTSVCTPPFLRNTYDRADRDAPELTPGETYVQTRENVGSAANTLACPSDIPIQSFEIF